MCRKVVVHPPQLAAGSRMAKHRRQHNSGRVGQLELVPLAVALKHPPAMGYNQVGMDARPFQ